MIDNKSLDLTTAFIDSQRRFKTKRKDDRYFTVKKNRLMQRVAFSSDICDCKDYRQDHVGGHGPCKIIKKKRYCKCKHFKPFYADEDLPSDAYLGDYSDSDRYCGRDYDVAGGLHR